MYILITILLVNAISRILELILIHHGYNSMFPFWGFFLYKYRFYVHVTKHLTSVLFGLTTIEIALGVL